MYTPVFTKPRSPFYIKKSSTKQHLGKNKNHKQGEERGSLPIRHQGQAGGLRATTDPGPRTWRVLTCVRKEQRRTLEPLEGGRKSSWEEGQEIPLHRAERKELLKIMTMKILHLEISKTDLKKESEEMANAKQHFMKK